MFQKRGRCGRCQQVVDFGFVHVGQYEARNILPPPRQAGFHMSVRALDYEEEGPDVLGYGTALCGLCNRPSFFLFKTKEKFLRKIRESLNTPEGLWGGGDLIQTFEALPVPPEPEIDPHWPAEIHDLFRDAQNMLSHRGRPVIASVAISNHSTKPAAAAAWQRAA